MEGKLIISKAESIKVAVIGSRTITCFDLSPYIPENCGLIISGGAKGIDTLAEQYAKEHNIETLVIRPDYEKYGRAAPIRRNDIIVDHADMVLAIWDGVSRGTKYVIDYATNHNKVVKAIEAKPID